MNAIYFTCDYNNDNEKFDEKKSISQRYKYIFKIEILHKMLLTNCIEIFLYKKTRLFRNASYFLFQILL